MKAKRIFGCVALLTVVFGTILSGCSPAPRRELSVEERKADLAWVYSVFGENYAPLEYKEQRNGFKFDSLKASYLEAAERTQNNEQFFLLLHSFVAEFKDAHTSSTLMASNLPGRSKVAYLGFSGQRSGDVLEVTSILPTYKKDSLFPIKVGDRIRKINGKTLKEYVDATLIKYRNLGHAESNYTQHFNKIFARSSLMAPMPAEQDVVLVVTRNDKDREVILPWIVKDLVEFQAEQAEAERAQSSSQKKAGELEVPSLFELAMKALSGEIDLVPESYRRISRASKNYNYLNSFIFVNDQSAFIMDLLADAQRKLRGQNPQAAIADLNKARKVPDSAVFIQSAVTYPTYVFPNENELVAVMYLDTFSPSTEEDKVIEELKKTLKLLVGMNVKKLVIDMINNGGGSLSLGMSIAQALSPQKVIMPSMQFKTSETWLDEFDQSRLKGPSDAERELSRRVFADLMEDKRAGKRLSRPMNAETLVPFALNPNADLKQPLKMAVLVNEMCASMCDIFTAILKDNNLAIVVGSQTMGAGGNVVDHGSAPNSALSVRQTESLITRADGSYIENNGVRADVEVDVSSDTVTKYSGVYKKAFEALSKN